MWSQYSLDYRESWREKKNLLEYLPWGNNCSSTLWPKLSGSLILSRPSLILKPQKKEGEQSHFKIFSFQLLFTICEFYIVLAES